MQMFKFTGKINFHLSAERMSEAPGRGGGGNYYTYLHPNTHIHTSSSGSQRQVALLHV